MISGLPRIHESRTKSSDSSKLTAAFGASYKIYGSGQGATTATNFCIPPKLRESNGFMQMVESRTVESECLPFSSIPHTTLLFEDFLHHFDKVSRFYSQPPLMRDWW